MKARETIHAEISKCIDKIKKEGSEQAFRSTIHHILDQQDSGQYERRELVDAVQELFFTGHDTSASSMASILMFLGRQPEVLQRVREELDAEGLLDCPDEELDLSLNKIYKLKYLYSVVREVLRVASPVGAGYRKALRTFEVGVNLITLESFLFIKMIVVANVKRSIENVLYRKRQRTDSWPIYAVWQWWWGVCLQLYS